MKKNYGQAMKKENFLQYIQGMMNMMKLRMKNLKIPSKTKMNCRH